jgi:hypothetical protein
MNTVQQYLHQHPEVVQEMIKDIQEQKIGDDITTVISQGKTLILYNTSLIFNIKKRKQHKQNRIVMKNLIILNQKKKKILIVVINLIYSY